jgi:hypothetical protein
MWAQKFSKKKQDFDEEIEVPLWKIQLEKLFKIIFLT